MNSENCCGFVYGTTGGRWMIMHGAAVALSRRLKAQEIDTLFHCGSSGGSIVAKLMSSDIPDDERLETALESIHLTKYARVGGWSTIRNAWNTTVHGALLYWERVWEKAFVPMVEKLTPNGEKAYAVTFNQSSNMQMIIPLSTAYGAKSDARSVLAKYDAKSVISSCALQGWISPVHWEGKELKEVGIDIARYGMKEEDVAVACDGGTSSALALEEAYTEIPEQLNYIEKYGRPAPIIAIDVNPIGGLPKAQFNPNLAGNLFTGGGIKFIFNRFLGSLFSIASASTEQAVATNKAFPTRATYIVLIPTTGEYTDSNGNVVDLASFGSKFETTKEEARAMFEYGYTWMEKHLDVPLSQVSGLQGLLCQCDGRQRDYTLIEALEHYFEKGQGHDH